MGNATKSKTAPAQDRFACEAKAARATIGSALTETRKELRNLLDLRRWTATRPKTMLGVFAAFGFAAGVGVQLAGVETHAKAKSRSDSDDARSEDATTTGCTSRKASADVAAPRSQGNRESKWSQRILWVVRVLKPMVALWKLSQPQSPPSMSSNHDPARAA